MCFSKILDKIGKTEIGRKLDGTFLSPPLKIGVTLADFHSSGKTLSTKIYLSYQ